MGEGKDDLQALFEPRMNDFVQGQSQNDRNGKADQDLHGADDEGVFQSSPEFLFHEQVLKIEEPVPGAAGDAVCHVVILEGQLNAVHGRIFEDDQKQKTRQQDQVNVLVTGDVLSHLLPIRAPGTGQWFDFFYKITPGLEKHFMYKE